MIKRIFWFIKIRKMQQGNNHLHSIKFNVSLTFFFLLKGTISWYPLSNYLPLLSPFRKSSITWTKQLVIWNANVWSNHKRTILLQTICLKIMCHFQYSLYSTKFQISINFHGHLSLATFFSHLQHGNKFEIHT